MYNAHTLTFIMMAASPIWCARVRSDADRDEVQRCIDRGLFRRVTAGYGHLVVDHSDSQQDFVVELTEEGIILAGKIKMALVSSGITNKNGLMNMLVP